MHRGVMEMKSERWYVVYRETETSASKSKFVVRVATRRVERDPLPVEYVILGTVPRHVLARIKLYTVLRALFISLPSYKLRL